MNRWREITLDELGTVERGRSRHRPRNDPSLYGSEMPFFQTGDVKSAVLHLGHPRQWYSAAGVQQSRVWDPGITCITIAANIADTAVLGIRGCFPDSVLGFTPSDHADDGYFVKYLLDGHRVRLGAAARGTTQDNLSLEKLLSFRFSVPPAAERAMIARTLRSLDELIENNHRRVEVLEEMARAIYQEWFVRFLYPGHETAPLVDSHLGPIPSGWEARNVREVARVVRGRSYRKHELVGEGGLPFVNLKCMARGGGFRRDGLKRYTGEYKPEQLVGVGDIVLAVTDLTQGREILARATLVPRLAEPTAVVSLDVVRLLPNEQQENLWIFAALRWSDFADRVKEFANGSTVLHLSPKHLADGLLLWPPQAVRHEFTRTVKGMLDQVNELVDSSLALAEMRDLLLPKLVTGQLDVSALDLDGLLEGAVA